MRANCTDGLVSLDGLYEFIFTPQCEDDGTEAPCTTLLSSSMVNDSGLALSVASSYSDTCDDASLFLAGEWDLSSTLTFYTDDDWDTVKRWPYVIGEDVIYGQIETELQSGDLSIEQVYVCTAPGLFFGCLSAEKDTVEGTYTIIDNVEGTRTHRGHSFYVTEEDHVARFSFRAFGMLLCHLSTLQRHFGGRVSGGVYKGCAVGHGWFEQIFPRRPLQCTLRTRFTCNLAEWTIHWKAPPASGS